MRSLSDLLCGLFVSSYNENLINVHYMGGEFAMSRNDEHYFFARLAKWENSIAYVPRPWVVLRSAVE